MNFAGIVQVVIALVGPMIVIFAFWLAYTIVKGNVTERNSFGLVGVVAIISAMGAVYGNWAYGARSAHPPLPETQKGASDGTDKKA